MDWLPALLKHLAVSRSVVGAAFVTCGVLYVGPRVAPGYVDPVPKEWSFALVGVLVFSGFLLTLWGLGAGWVAAKRRWSATSAMFASFDLSQMEVDVLHSLGENPSEPLNLERLDYDTSSLSRLELLELMHGLQKKGLVSSNPYSGGKLFSLTSAGRQRALEIHRASNANAA